MDEVDKDDVLTILWQCSENGRKGPDALWAWFLDNKDLIELTYESIMLDRS